MITWNEVAAIIGVSGVVVSGVAWLIRSLVVHYLSRDLEAYKAALRSEVDREIARLQIHDKERLDAHKRLFAFAKGVQGVTYPLAEDKAAGLVQVADEQWGRVQMDVVYFSDETAEILEKFGDTIVCIKRPELLAETATEINDFLEGRAFEYAEHLASYARKAVPGVAVKPPPTTPG